MKLLILANFDVGLYQFRRELIAELLNPHVRTLDTTINETVQTIGY